jgi:hypothetical protein
MPSSEATDLTAEPAEATEPRVKRAEFLEPRLAAKPLVQEAAPAARREPSERLANVERLRIVAMLEIVTFHVGGALANDTYRLPIVGGLGLPVSRVSRREGVAAAVAVARLVWRLRRRRGGRENPAP